jgi:predicted GIY-YIG superfamily endonuclease
MLNRCFNNEILSKTTCECKKLQEMGSRRPFSSWPCPLQNHTVRDMITNITDITKYIQTANTFRSVVNNMTLKWSFRWELGVTTDLARKVQNHTVNTHTRHTYTHSRIQLYAENPHETSSVLSQRAAVFKNQVIKMYIFHGNDIHN